MIIDLYPEARGEIKHAFLPVPGENEYCDLGNFQRYLEQDTNATVTNLSLAGRNGYRSLGVRDPAIFLGYGDADKPIILMSEPDLLGGVGSYKDIEDAIALLPGLLRIGATAEICPFFVIGGDCYITDRHAIFGWVTPQVTGWAYENYQKGVDAITRTLANFELDTLFIDDIGELDLDRYRKRIESASFHLDLVANFPVNESGEVESVVAKPNRLSTPSDEDVRYMEYASETLDRAGYAVTEVPSHSVLTRSVWSATNALLQGGRRIAFLSSSYNDELDASAASVYENLGYETRIVRLEPDSHIKKIGVRCASFVIRK